MHQLRGPILEARVLNALWWATQPTFEVLPFSMLLQNPRYGGIVLLTWNCCRRLDCEAHEI